MALDVARSGVRDAGFPHWPVPSGEMPGDASSALSPDLGLNNTRTALAFLGNPMTEGWPSGQ